MFSMARRISSLTRQDARSGRPAALGQIGSYALDENGRVYPFVASVDAASAVPRAAAFAVGCAFNRSTREATLGS
jgi:hypothetical protein